MAISLQSVRRNRLIAALRKTADGALDFDRGTVFAAGCAFKTANLRQSTLEENTNDFGERTQWALAHPSCSVGSDHYRTG
jgi:hypothetical protein